TGDHGPFLGTLARSKGEEPATPLLGGGDVAQENSWRARARTTCPDHPNRRAADRPSRDQASRHVVPAPLRAPRAMAWTSGCSLPAAGPKPNHQPPIRPRPVKATT